MCGICGIALAGERARVEEAVLRRMNARIEHRGPDDDGLLLCGPVGLAMRRLSIIDVDGGSQPIANEDGSIRLVFNGEIYNYRELREELRAAGHSFATASDTEVVVHAYEQFGPAFLNRLRGMFALAIWDGRSQDVLLAVDRFGIKPLYYASAGGSLVFGSELKCLLASGMTPREIDFAALSEYFTLGYIPAPASIMSGVKKLPPGHMLRWRSLSGVEVAPYWTIPLSGVRRLPEAELREDLRRRLRETVRAHMVSDVPVGAFLSGGIDSGTIVALMAEASPAPIQTFTIGFADRRHDERDLARLVARRYGTDHHELVVEPESLDLLPRLVDHFDEPFADSSAVPAYVVSRMAGRSVKVALSGDGGDELFLGYTYFRGVDLARRLRPVAAPLRKALDLLPRGSPAIIPPAWNDRVAAIGKRVNDSLLPPLQAYRSKVTMVGLARVAESLSREVRDRLDRTHPYRSIDGALRRAASVTGSHALDPIVHAGQAVSLPGDMLVKVDRMSMANSLEVRVPLVDHELAEFVAGIPIDQRLPGWRLKGLLKDTVAGLLPAEVLRQPKHGFTVPLSAWVRGDHHRFASSILLGSEARSSGFYDSDGMAGLLQRHTERGGGLGAAVWSLLMFELWRQRILA